VSEQQASAIYVQTHWSKPRVSSHPPTLDPGPVAREAIRQGKGLDHGVVTITMDLAGRNLARYTDAIERQNELSVPA
jgi:hypothetical protein